jgi:hypothetical protein
MAETGNLGALVGAAEAGSGIAGRQPNPHSTHRGAAPIAILRKNAAEEIRVGLSQFNGHDLLSIRVWRAGGSEPIPTKAGIACKVTLLPELIEALQQAEAAARAAGLLPP